MRGKFLLVVGVVIVLAVGAGAVYWLRQRQNPAASRAAIAAANPFSGPVASLPGHIEATEIVPVPVPFAGKLESLPVDVGAMVAEGELLAEIRSSSLESQKDAVNNEVNRVRARSSLIESNLIAARLEAARAGETAESTRASVDAAQKALSRQQLLYDKGAGAKQDLEKAQAAYDSVSRVYQAQQKVWKLADDKVAALTKDLDDQQQALTDKNKEYEDAVEQVGTGDVKSPVDGLVIARKGKVGDDVTLETEDLFQIAVNLTQLRVVVEVPPPLAGKFRTGQEAMIQIAELAEGIPSTVSEVQEGRVLVDFTSPNLVVKPGMTAQVVIRLN